jgi:hypothetical protein
MFLGLFYGEYLTLNGTFLVASVHTLVLAILKAFEFWRCDSSHQNISFN